MKYKESDPQVLPANDAVAVVIETVEETAKAERPSKSDDIEETYKDIIMTRLSLIRDSAEIVEKTLRKLYKISDEAND